MSSGTNGDGRCPLRITDDSVRGLRDLTTDHLTLLVKSAMRELASRFHGGREIPLPEGVNLIYTTDLALATYWDRHGCPVVGFRPNPSPRAGRNQAVEFVHADHDHSSERLAVAFASSDEAAFNARMGILKKEAIRIRDMRATPKKGR